MQKFDKESKITYIAQWKTARPDGVNVQSRKCPKYISELFQTMKTNYNLHMSDFVTPRYNTVTYGKHLIRYLGPYLLH